MIWWNEQRFSQCKPFSRRILTIKNEGKFFLDENSWLILDKRRPETEELSKNLFYLEQRRIWCELFWSLFL